MYRNKIYRKRRMQNMRNKPQESDVKKGSLFKEILSDYSSSSTLHGINYLGADDKNLAEKIWWLITFILSVVVCSYLINKTWIKWRENPVILSFEKEQVPVKNIPFPAVTVCPLNKILQTEYNYTEMFWNRHNLIDDDYKLFWDLSLICHPESFATNISCSINITDKSAITMINEHAPNLNQTLQKVSWHSSSISHLSFGETITEEGQCFTFNGFNQEDMYTDELDHDTIYIHHKFRTYGWTLEDGYTISSLDVYPRRSATSGMLSSLRMSLISHLDDTDYVCGVATSGFKIILHNPTENPKVSQQYFLVPLNGQYTMIIRPELVSTSKSLRDLPPHTRKCFFSDEKNLRFYKVYTQDNCRVECTANITRQFCGCVPFYMPRDKNTAICGYGSSDCIKKILDIILKLEIMKEFSYISEEDHKNLKNTYEIFSRCDCLPSCTSLQYSAETSRSDMHFTRTLLEGGFITYKIKKLLEKNRITQTEVQIFFKESQFFALHRSELFGQTYFLANCGGLLGLFMGFSLLSIIEIFYFLTIRLWFIYSNRRKYNGIK